MSLSITLSGTGRAEDMPLRLIGTTGHKQSIGSLDWSSDGKRLITGSGDNTAKLWDVESGALIRTFSSPKGYVRGWGNAVRAVGFVGDGRKLVIAGTDGARVWDARSGVIVDTVDAPTNSIGTIAVLSDGSSLVTAGSGDPENGAPPLLRLHDRISNTSRELPLESVYSIAALALSRDGNLLAVGGSDIAKETPGGVETKGATRIWDLRSTKVLRIFDEFTDNVDWVAFSPDNRDLYTHAGGKVIRRRIETGIEVRSFRGWNVSLSADGKYLATDAINTSGIMNDSGDLASDAAIIWDAERGTRIASIPWPAEELEATRSRVSELAFSSDAASLAIGLSSGKIAIWDVAAGEYQQIWHSRTSGASKVQLIDRDGERLIFAGELTATIWDLRSGRPTAVLGDHESGLESIAISPNGDLVATATHNGKVHVWDGDTGNSLRSFFAHQGPVSAIAFNGDGTRMITGGYDGAARLWRVDDGQLLRTIGSNFAIVRAVVFSPDGTAVLVGDELGEVHFFSHDGSRSIGELPNPSVSAVVMDAAFDSSGRKLIVAYGNGYNRALVYDFAKRALVYDFATSDVRPLGTHQSFVHSVQFDPAGRLAATGSWDETAKIWDVETGALVQTFEHRGDVLAVAFIAHGSQLATYADDTIHIWDVADSTKLLELVNLTGGGWAAVASTGRLDAGNLEEISSLNWLAPDDPFTPLPPEVFMRDYYEPRLLPRLLACHEAEDGGDADACDREFKPVRRLTDLNRVQSEVQVVSVEPEAGAADEVAVTIEVRGVARSFGDGEEQRTWRSGVYDLRLFRDGQLVGQFPEIDEAEPLAGGDLDVDLARWRGVHKIVESVGVERVTFRHVRLPRVEGLEEVEFTAYGFNADRVKSSTARESYRLPAGLTPRRGRAYVIAVGVSAYEDPVWNLRFADDDARRLSEVLPARLKATGQYETVVPITLVSDWEAREGDRVTTVSTATKANFRAVLDVLAGRRAVDEELERLLGAEVARQLQTVRPEDLVLIAYSSHGYADAVGNFYLFPYDVGRSTGGVVNEELLQRAVSSAELAAWLRDVDAGELVMVVDACHSAAGVEGGEFKPGPMGSRGLGQLAYDKGMRILASTRADDLAWEAELPGEGEGSGQGLLSYALVQEGLAEDEADFQPQDGAIRVPEWLRYAAERVPELYAEMRAGKLKDKGRLLWTPRNRGTVVVDEGQGPPPGTQQPSLFDFRRSDDEPLLANVAH